MHGYPSPVWLNPRQILITLIAREQYGTKSAAPNRLRLLARGEARQRTRSRYPWFGGATTNSIPLSLFRRLNPLLVPSVTLSRLPWRQVIWRVPIIRRRAEFFRKISITECRKEIEQATAGYVPKIILHFPDHKIRSA